MNEILSAVATAAVGAAVTVVVTKLMQAVFRRKREHKRHGRAQHHKDRV